MNYDKEKLDGYTKKIGRQLAQIFNPECEDYINPEELEDEATLFCHALLNLAPGIFYNRLVEENLDVLQVNHVANRLAFQFSNLDTTSQITSEDA